MRIIKFSTLSFFLGLVFFAISFAAATKLEQSKKYNFPESVGRHYAKYLNAETLGEVVNFNREIPAVASNGTITAIEIETTAVDVEIRPTDTDKITFDLNARRIDPNNPLLFDESKAGVVRVRTQEGDEFKPKSRHVVLNFDSGDSHASNLLVVRVPKTIRETRVETISGAIEVDAPLAGLRFQTKSGDMHIKRDVEKLVVESVSGDATTEAQIKDVMFNSVSGDLNLHNAATIDSVSAQTVSGDASIEFAEGTPSAIESATITFSSKSGEIELDDSISTQIGRELRKNKGQEVIVIGGGHAKIGFSSVSGDLSVLKKTL